MAFELIDEPFPGLVASAVQDRQVVVLIGGSAERAVGPASNASQIPHGITGAASQAVGEAVAVRDLGDYAKAIAAASIGVGAEMAVIGATRSLGIAAGASGVAKWSVGYAVSAAAAGEVFTLYVRPRQISGLV